MEFPMAVSRPRSPLPLGVELGATGLRLADSHGWHDVKDTTGHADRRDVWWALCVVQTVAKVTLTEEPSARVEFDDESGAQVVLSTDANVCLRE